MPAIAIGVGLIAWDNIAANRLRTNEGTGT